MNSAKALNAVFNHRVAHPGLKLKITDYWVQYIQISRVGWDELFTRCQIICQRNWTDSYSLFVERGAKCLPAQRLDQEFHPRFHSCFALAVSVEETQRSSREIEQIFHWKKVRVEMRQLRPGAQTTAQVNSEAPTCLIFLDPRACP